MAKKKPFYCISHYDGDVSWLNSLAPTDYIIYSKGQSIGDEFKNVIHLDNVGYNIYSYLTYIIEHYECLPEKIIFCKNNIMQRHVSKSIFEEQCLRDEFTPLEDPSFWDRLTFPASFILNDGGYVELNNNWYADKYERKYFSSFNKFYQFIFQAEQVPVYLRFAPGANYVVPKVCILKRSKNFYINLRRFVSHSQFSCESHYIERSLVSIWHSEIPGSTFMQSVLDEPSLAQLTNQCQKESSVHLSYLAKYKRFMARKIMAKAHQCFLTD